MKHFKWYTINGTLFRWYSSYADVFGMAIYEEDGGTTKIGITISGKTYGIEYKDGDDSLGLTVVNFGDPYNDLYDTGDARWYMRFAP